MAVRLEGIHFLVTYRCTYACDHCFVWGSPDADGTMTLAQLTSVIDQGAELGLTDVYFEGGEPTLAYPIVLAAAKHARERGLDVGIVSNCFWATSVADARVWLAPFAELGLADLSLSSYAYFVEDANEEQLRNAVLAAQELGIPVSVLEVGAPADIGVPGACSGDVGEIMHKGRAAVALAPAKASRPPETLVTCPFEDFTDPGRAHVGPDGELQVCQGISAGNVFAGGDGPPAPEHLAVPLADGLRRVLDAYDPHARPVIREILAGGPWALAQAVGHAPARSSTPTSVTSAMKSVPRCAAPAASPRWSRRDSATPRTNPRRGKTMPSECETLLGRRQLRDRRPPGQQEAVPQDHLRRAQGARRHRLPHGPGRRDRRGRQGLRRLRRAARRRSRRRSWSFPRRRRPRGSPRRPTPASRRSGSTR